MKKRIGFIGAGNMAFAMMRALKEDFDLVASDTIAERLRMAKDAFNARTTADNGEVVRESELIFLAVKPQVMKAVLGGLKAEEKKGKIFISIAAGVPLSFLEANLNARSVRVMPNTPCLVGEMAAGYSFGRGFSEKDKRTVRFILEKIGLAIELPEDQLDAVTGLSGSGPAFAARFIEAMIEAGVEAGLSREDSRKLALKTVEGTAKLLAEEGLEPKELVQAVSSPNGTTVAGREVLENSDFREVVKKSVLRAKERSEELKKGFE